MSEDQRWEHTTETVGGLFRLRSTKCPQVQAICASRGEEGWQLVDVAYDWFTVTYVLFFKRPRGVH